MDDYSRYVRRLFWTEQIFFGNLYKYFCWAGTRVLVGQEACLLGWVPEVPGAAGCRQVGSVANIFAETVMIFPPQAAPA